MHVIDNWAIEIRPIQFAVLYLFPLTVSVVYKHIK